MDIAPEPSQPTSRGGAADAAGPAAVTTSAPPPPKTAGNLRRLTLWRLSLTPAQRLQVNADSYRLWRAGQLNRARMIAERREARRAPTGR